MKIFILVFVGAAVFYHSQNVQGHQLANRLVCYYDTTMSNIDNQVYIEYFEKQFSKALVNCTHLVFSSAEISAQSFVIKKFKVKSKPIELKRQFPHLKIFLSLGGGAEKSQPQEYLRFLEADQHQQQHFIEDLRNFLKFYKFDGLDLAFPLPRNKPRKVHSSLALAVKKLKHLFTGNEIIDINAEKHKVQYTNLVYNLKKAFQKENFQLSMTVLPNVNSTWYFDIFKIHKNFEFINLFAFDFLTPSRNPQEADYSAPIYFKESDNRLAHYNVEFQVDHWINNGCPVQKLNLGISTYGRAWRLSIDSGLSGIPVIESTNGAADPGKYSKIPGILSWPEICIKLTTRGALQKVIDAERKYGNYAFRPADRNGNNGIWISFDDPDFAGVKTEYVREKGMGGVALYNLNNDDFQKFCMGPVFPILSRISEGLGILHHVYKHNASFMYNNLV